jgi:ribosome-associated translation inhibitor RaiA
MQNQVQISFHGVDHSDAVETNIRERVAKLDKMFERITACRVVVEAEHNGHSHLNPTHKPFQVSVKLSLPGDELYVKNDNKKHAEDYDDVNVAVRDAFSVMERRLRDYVRKRWYDARQREMT